MVKNSSKSKKKGWKRIDVEDVDQHLQDERLKERLGPSDSKISFVIDTATSGGVLGQQKVKEAPVRTRQLKTTRDLTSSLSCFKSLIIQSKVPALRSRPGPKAKVPSVKLTKERAAPEKNACTPVDLWASVTEDETSKLVKEQLKLSGKHTAKVPPSVYTKPNLVAAMELPDHGVSYNPSDTDLNLLVKRVVRQEISQKNKEDRLNHSVTKFYQSKSTGQIEAEYMQEMAQGLVVTDDSDADDGETGKRPKNAPVTAAKRKTKKQRNREQTVKQAARELRARKELLKRSKQPLGIPKLLKEIREQQMEKEKRQKVRDAKAMKRMFEPKKRYRLLQEEVVPDPADIRGSLRTVKVEGNLMEDRFKNLVARSLVEVEKKKEKRKSRKSLPTRKLYVKRSHRTDVC